MRYHPCQALACKLPLTLCLEWHMVQAGKIFFLARTHYVPTQAHFAGCPEVESFVEELSLGYAYGPAGNPRGDNDSLRSASLSAYPQYLACLPGGSSDPGQHTRAVSRCSLLGGSFPVLCLFPGSAALHLHTPVPGRVACPWHLPLHSNYHRPASCRPPPARGAGT